MSVFGTPKFFATTLGYYSHSAGARYISPIETGAQFPDLVELHESQHEHLALGNATDELGQIFVKVIEWGKGELRRDHESSIRSLFGVIHDQTMYVHEVIATWISFSIFAKKHPEGVKPARKSLPSFYEGVLRDGEAAFGSIADPRIDSTDVLLAFSCGEVAMNLLYPVEIVRFDRLRECAELLRKNSPNARFRSILRSVRPRWNGGIFAGFQMPEDAGDFHPAAFERIRAEFPGLQFLPAKGRETLVHNWWAELRADTSRYGYKFLDDAEVKERPSDTPDGSFGARVTLPGLSLEDPLDLSLVRIRYAKGSLEDLRSAALLCAREQHWLYAHVLVRSSLAMVACFASQRMVRSNITPFSALCPFKVLIEELTQLPSGAVIVKIDERDGRDVWTTLGGTGQPVFVLIHDARPRRLIATIRNAAATQKVMITRFEMLGDRYSALLAVLLQERICLIAPITRLGSDLLEPQLGRIPNVFSLKKKDEWLNCLPAKPEVISELVYTCFVA